ncbi:MAG: Lrp/AsnC family transcriptional regulator [Nanobdellota archaeon]
MQEKDIPIISHLRKDARTPLTEISRATKIPKSTVSERIRTYNESIFHKHTSLLNFKHIGYNVRTKILFSVDKGREEEFLEHMKDHENTNNIYRVTNGFDFLIDAVFRKTEDLYRFYEEAEDKGSTDSKEYFVLQEIAREKFMEK